MDLLQVGSRSTCPLHTNGRANRRRKLVLTALALIEIAVQVNERNDSMNSVGSQARVDFGGANQPKGSEERSRTC